MKCVICNKEVSEGNYCDSHKSAYENIVNKYDCWKLALGVSWKGYLREIVKNLLTGEYAKEVAEYLIKSGEEPDVAKS